ncbi:MAG: CorA family divalent cation transporter, partial [Verrucomicrobiota bacterium]
SSRLFGLSYPHLEPSNRHIALFVQVPEMMAGGQIERRGLLVVAGATSLVTFSRQGASVVERVPKAIAAVEGPGPFPVQTTCQLLKMVLDRNEHLVGQFEQQLAVLEDLPVRESRPQFFEQTFRLKKELSAAQSDLWRLRGVLRELAEGRVNLPGSNGTERPLLHDLAEAADYLYETVNNIREGVLSLIDLHLNVVSFEMNRVMRVLAVVSVLGLIPAVVGGLFGMNLADNPWPFTLPQVTFAVGTAMIVCFYFFIVKGWLR